jgi:hypothetical protein
MQEVTVLERLRLEITKIVEGYTRELKIYRDAALNMENKYGLIIDDDTLYAQYAMICYNEALKKVEAILELYKNI